MRVYHRRSQSLRFQFPPEVNILLKLFCSSLRSNTKMPTLPTLCNYGKTRVNVAWEIWEIMPHQFYSMKRTERNRINRRFTKNNCNIPLPHTCKYKDFPHSCMFLGSACAIHPNLCATKRNRWSVWGSRISQRGCQHQSWDEKLSFGQLFPKNIKMNEIWPKWWGGGGGGHTCRR